MLVGGVLVRQNVNSVARCSLGIDEIVATAQSVRSYSGVLFSKEIGRLR